MNDISQVDGLAFFHPTNGSEFGTIRKVKPKPLPALAGYTVFAEDDCGNVFVESMDTSIHFWDHEFEELTLLATNWRSFVGGCQKPKTVELDPSQVISSWIDPEFAKKFGVQ